MKKKLIITCSLITILLAGFPHVLYAEDVPQDFEGGYTTHYGNISELDDYFYENFVLLPYLQADGTQFIDTGIKGSSELKIDLYFNNLIINSSSYMFGSKTADLINELSIIASPSYNGSILYRFYNGVYYYQYISDVFNINHIQMDKNECYFNESLVDTLTYTTFNNNLNLYLFSCNNNGNNLPISRFNLYYFSIYDYDADSGNGELVRSFYPARQKSNGSYGLYDAVNKIFYVSNSGTPFENPEGSDVELSLLSRIGLWIRTSLGSISEIFTYIVTEPIIMFFMAVGLAGVMYRWARRLVHF